MGKARGLSVAGRDHSTILTAKRGGRTISLVARNQREALEDAERKLGGEVEVLAFSSPDSIYFDLIGKTARRYAAVGLTRSEHSRSPA